LKADQRLLLTLGLSAAAGVLEGDHALREGLVFEEGEFALGEAAGEEEAAFADEDGDDADIKFVDHIVFEEVAGEFAAAHQPDVLSRAFAEILHETFWGFVDEGDPGALAGRLGLREDVALHFCVAEAASAHLESIIVGLATHDHRVDGGEERAHGIVLGHEEKIDRAIRAGNVAVEADAEAEDDLAHGRILNQEM
jgi:hypothetical protein